MGINRFVSFKAQRAFFSAVYTFLPTSLSVGVLWNHLDSLQIFIGFYLILAKIGLGLVEVTAIFFLLWELNVSDKALSNYCYFGNIAIVLMMLLHVGAVLQYDSAISKINTEKAETINLNKQVLELNNTLITQQGTAILKGSGQKMDQRTLREAVRTITETTAKNNRELTSEMLKGIGTEEKEAGIKTILPLWYIKGGTMYIVPILISFLLGVLALFISKTSPDLNQSVVVENIAIETKDQVISEIEKIANSDYFETDIEEFNLDSTSTVNNNQPTQDQILEELRK